MFDTHIVYSLSFNAMYQISGFHGMQCYIITRNQWTYNLDGFFQTRGKKGMLKAGEMTNWLTSGTKLKRRPSSYILTKSQKIRNVRWYKLFPPSTWSKGEYKECWRQVQWQMVLPPVPNKLLIWQPMSHLDQIT